MAPSLITTPATVTTQDATSTTTQPHAALTTPFIYPPHCSYALRSIEHHLLRSSTATTTATLLVLDPSNPAVVACHPSGWNSGSENFAFSGAVCPSGWDAHGMRRWGAFTTAHCCQRWYTLDVLEPWRLMPDNAACYRGRGADDGAWTATDRWNSTSVFSGGTGVWDVHAAWHITWAASDTDTLTPRPPEVTEMLATWTAETTMTTTSQGPIRDGPFNKGMTEFYLLLVGLPLLIVSLFVAMCVWACCSGRKGRKKRDDDVPLESVKREQSSG